jgi:hypothetical protein
LSTKQSAAGNEYSFLLDDVMCGVWPTKVFSLAQKQLPSGLHVVCSFAQIYVAAQSKEPASFVSRGLLKL